MRLNKKIRSYLAVLTIAFASMVPTQSHAITNALYLTMDGSGSISSSDFSLQKTGYVNALNAVFGGGGLFGNTAIGVSVFSSSVTQIFAIQAITNAADLLSLTNAITGITQPGGATAIGDAINHAAGKIQGAFATATNKVIDVSTDGFSNRGANPGFAANTVLASNSIKTNCIGIGGSANCGFATGFSVQVSNFSGFEAAVTKKLQRELGVVPAPAVAMLLAIGLFGVSFSTASRRRA